jgi:AraC-like DNA-binding protein
MLAAEGPYCIFIRMAGDGRRPPWQIPRRRMSQYLLVYSRSGDEQITVDGRAHEIREGGAYLIPPQVLSDIGSREGSEPVWIHFDVCYEPRRAEHPQVNAYAESLAGREPFLQPSPRETWGLDLPVVVPRELEELFAQDVPRILNLWHSGELLAHVEANHLLAGLLLTWVRTEAHRASGPRLAGLSLEQRISRAEMQARGSLGMSFGVEEFAAAAHLSRSRFTVLYHQLRKQTPAVFLRRERLREAAALLLRAELSVREVGRLVGYPDPSVFGRVFRREHGRSPHAWRERALARKSGHPEAGGVYH